MEDGERAFKVPPNLLFIGTVNDDETTYRFSPKVLDRANTIEFSKVYLDKKGKMDVAQNVDISFAAEFAKFIFSIDSNDELELQNSIINREEVKKRVHADNVFWDENVEILKGIYEVLAPENLHFGYRVRDEILTYLFHKKNASLIEKYEAMDFKISQKILPKIKGGPEIAECIDKLMERITKDKYKGSYEKLQVMRKRIDSPYGFTG